MTDMFQIIYILVVMWWEVIKCYKQQMLYLCCSSETHYYISLNSSCFSFKLTVTLSRFDFQVFFSPKEHAKCFSLEADIVTGVNLHAPLCILEAVLMHFT